MLKTALWYPAAFKFNQNQGPEAMIVSCFDERTLATFSNSNTIMLLRAAERYLPNPDKSKGNFPVHAFYKVSAQYFSALVVLFLELCSIDMTLFVSSLLVSPLKQDVA